MVQIAAPTVEGGALCFNITEESLDASFVGDLHCSVNVRERFVLSAARPRNRRGHHEELHLLDAARVRGRLR